MTNMANPVYAKETLEFVAVAYEFCAWMESLSDESKFQFVSKATKFLPLLYLKARLLPEVEDIDDDSDLSQFITEDTYDALRQRIVNLLGEHDTYLETFLPDMQYSDTPIAAFISENMADIFQDVGNFVASFREENETIMQQALWLCQNNFQVYWGQTLLNTLKAVHAIQYNQDIDLNEENIDE